MVKNVVKSETNLTRPITYLKGVGEQTASLLAKLGVETYQDLLELVPRRYEDYSQISKISKVEPGKITVLGQFSAIKSRYSRHGLHVTEAVLDDGSGKLAVIWFNQPYRAEALKPGVDYYVSGELEFRRQRFALTNPSLELVSDWPTHTARIVPVYPQTRGLQTVQIRRLVKELLKSQAKLPESLPTAVIKEAKLLSRDQAWRELHYPTSAEHLEQAQRRLAWEDTFALAIAAQLARSQLHGLKAKPIPFSETQTKALVARLPFTLTDGQRLAAWEILKDLKQPQPMNRLLEGDVGSGKTVVAALAMLNVAQAGGQSALVAPTDLLARQHGERLAELLEPLGVSVGLLTGSQTTSGAKRLKEQLTAGQAQVLVGTHSVLQPSLHWQQLDLVVIDEQHRFGVEQRRQLLKRRPVPHMLTMTATPIPRTLALTVYGELDISVIKELPAERKPIKTKLWSAKDRVGLYKKVNELLNDGQAFVVCPHIDPSLTGPTRSVGEVVEELAKLLPKRRIGLVHGRLAAVDRDAVMAKFANGKLDVLVATTVVEVGIDVPGASVMVIEGAERFGLAQIHQLRGRVGRRGQAAFCYLVPSSGDSPSHRLKELEKTQNGFELAELDLKLRGPGEIYGQRQHGQLDLKFAPISDGRQLKQIRDLAEEFVQKPKNLVQYPQLESRVLSLMAITRLN